MLYFIINIQKLYSEIFIDYKEFKEIIYEKVIKKLFALMIYLNNISEPFNSIIEYFFYFWN